MFADQWVKEGEDGSEDNGSGKPRTQPTQSMLLGYAEGVLFAGLRAMDKKFKDPDQLDVFATAKAVEKLIQSYAAMKIANSIKQALKAQGKNSTIGRAIDDARKIVTDDGEISEEDFDRQLDLAMNEDSE